MKKLYIRIFLFFLFFLISFSSFSFGQKAFLSPLGLKYFPETEEILPDFVQSLFPKHQPKEISPIHKKESLLSAGENYLWLKSFFLKLDYLQNHKNGVVRIIHLGDSIIWGGFITSKLTEHFQADFGDGGRGLIPIVPSVKRKLIHHNNQTTPEQFISENIEALGNHNPKLGFLGESFIPIRNPIYLKHFMENSQKPWTKLELYIRNTSPNLLNASLQAKDGSLSKTIDLSNSGCSKILFDLPDANQFTLSLSGIKLGELYLDTISLETDYGIAYSPVSRQGIEMNDLLTVPEENFACGMRLYSPDLILFQFGVNESQNMLHSKEPIQTYKEKLTNVVQRFKKYNPNSSILILSPYERIIATQDGKFVTMPEIANIIQAQKEVCEEFGIAFYDSFLALGGQGHNELMYNKGYIQPDRIHLTRIGGDYYAGILYNEIYTAYQKFLGHQEFSKKLELEKLKKEKNKEIYFNSKAYAYFFVLVFFVSAFLTRIPNLKITFLTFVSLYFYSTWNFLPTLLIVFSTCIDYVCSLLIFKRQTFGKRGTVYLVLSLFLNLSLLFFFKYYDFFVSLLNHLVINGSQVEISMLHLTLPVGISFYTFQSLSYTIDVYRKQLTPEKNFTKFASYVTFFPQLVAGPIVRAIEFLPRLKEKGQHFLLSPTKFQIGIFIILAGLLKKTGADWLAVHIIDKVYANPEMYSSIEAIAALYAYGLQIYGDFSGYTDIAIGSAMILGFHLTKNFDYPYSSFSITDFWRRWHISLGSWFRDYLYISLGGSRNGVYRNLFITMFLCGLWHGAGIAFILWGIYHGVLLAIERFAGLDKRGDSWFINFFRQLITLHLVLFGWWIFRSDSYETFSGIWTVISKGTASMANLEWTTVWVILLSYFYYTFLKNLKMKLQNLWLRIGVVLQALTVVVVIALLYNLSIAEIQPFIYFQF
ncbi:MAG: hypothetical protein H7A23_22170 [Leptospiraceae bacterium]|nr:hypothetical protein [Leptospiraceae bacterium]